MNKRVLRNIVATVGATVLSLTLMEVPVFAQTPGLKINQVYGGGGMSASGWKYDYVELINTSTIPVAYANVYIFVGKYNLNPTTVTIPSVNIPPKSFYLIRFAGSASNQGTDLTTQDFDAGNVLLPGGNSGDNAVGVVMLYSQNPNAPTSCNVTVGLLDKVSYGGFLWTNCYEGTQSPLFSDGTHALERRIVTGNAQDSDNNANDFTLVAPNPRNSGSQPLPVQLVNLTAMYTSDRGIKVSWSTASEIDNYGFTVERRIEGDAGFGELPGSFQAGHGTTLNSYTYFYTDGTASPGVNYQYRIKQVDLDGMAHYSEVVNVANGTTAIVSQAGVAKGFTLKQNYPNPFNPSTMIEFGVKETGTATLRVYNALGQEVGMLFNESAEAGLRYVVRFDGTKFSTGMYVARLESGSDIRIMKMTLIK